MQLNEVLLLVVILNLLITIQDICVIILNYVIPDTLKKAVMGGSNLFLKFISILLKCTNWRLFLFLKKKEKDNTLVDLDALEYINITTQKLILYVFNFILTFSLFIWNTPSKTDSLMIILSLVAITLLGITLQNITLNSRLYTLECKIYNTQKICI